MAENSLRKLRREAGFSSARAFAEHVGIPAPTYAKYEQIEDGPDTPMPIKNAWAIADALGCSIDTLVGRGTAPVENMGGDLQRRFDALSEDGKLLVADFMAMAEMREERASEQRRAELAQRYMREARRIDAAFTESLYEGMGDAAYLSLGGEEDMREAFEAFAYAKANAAEDAAIESKCRHKRVLAERRGYAIEDVPGRMRGLKVEKDDPRFGEVVEADVSEFRKILESKKGDRVQEVMEGIMAAYDAMYPHMEGRVEYAMVNLS